MVVRYDGYLQITYWGKNDLSELESSVARYSGRDASRSRHVAGRRPAAVNGAAK